MSVRSYLGQPLHVTINLLDPSPNTTADCFSLGAQKGSIAPPLHAQLSIAQSGGQTVIHIRTPQSVNDPVTQFELVSDCETHLQRTYVVLLDPPQAVAPAIAAPAPATGQGKADSARTAATPGRARVPRASHRRRPVRRHVAAVTAHAQAASSRRPAAHDKRTSSSAAKPRLVLSGKHGRLSGESLALQLDTHLPDTNRPLPEDMTPTEMSDETAALNHRITLLEAQLLDLQQRNARLEARRTAVASNVAPPSTAKPVQWPMYLLISGLLASGIALLFWWLRRRSIQTHARFAQVGGPPETSALAGSVPLKSDSSTQPVSWQIENPPAPQRMSEIAPPPPNQSTEVKDDILDQAEVYMAHGHGELAIHLLQEHVRNAPDESPVPWLLLLDLLHRDGDEPGYKAASAECRRHFNINLTGHPISQDSDAGNGLEAYPHLFEQLVKVWGTPNIDDFFRDLLYDNRGGTRIGFDPGAYRDILLLRTIAQNVAPPVT
jgi:Tfp pilus assembly protein FimV